MGRLVSEKKLKHVGQKEELANLSKRCKTYHDIISKTGDGTHPTSFPLYYID